MNTYARIQNGVVAELIATDLNPAQLFNPGLQWVLVEASGVAPGWVASINSNTGAVSFAPPPPAAPSLPVVPSIAQLQAELAVLTAQIATLTATTNTGG
jgi:hypothetical protein